MHNYSIGDPSVPPIPPKLKHLVHDSEWEGPFETSGKKYYDPRKYSGWNMHRISENSYRDFIVIDGSKYSTDHMQRALNNKANVLESVMPVKKGIYKLLH